MNKNLHMMKILLPMLAIAANVASAPFNFFKSPGSGNIAGRTPSIRSHHGSRSRARVPNDGRWHMKFHRSRR